MTQVSKTIKNQIAQFQDEQKGDVAAIFGLTACLLMASAGAAVDIGRAVHARSQTQSALDAAVLAGARHLQINGVTSSAVADATEMATLYYKENITQRISGVEDPGPEFTTTDNNTKFVGKATATIETYLLKALAGWGIGSASLPVTADAEAALTVGENAGVNLEISMMLDTSGSMTGQKMTDLKKAAADLVNIVVWEDQSEYTSRLAIAPFSADMRLPPSWNAAARGAPAATKTLRNGSTVNRTDCVVERHGTEKFSDAAPSSGQFVTTRYTSNGACGQPVVNEAIALTDDKELLTSRIQNLTISSSTAGQIGTAWAWYMLSPHWASVFPAESAPVAYGSGTNTQKIAILMTDGEYNTQYKLDGTNGTSPNGGSSAQATALCSAMKSEGITVYTVGFDLGGNSTAISTLQSCATSGSHFYNAEDGNALKAAFRDIALKLSSLYLSK